MSRMDRIVKLKGVERSTRTHVAVLSGMVEAVAKMRSAFTCKNKTGHDNPYKNRIKDESRRVYNLQFVPDAMLKGLLFETEYVNYPAVDKSVEISDKADELIDEAILLDPRLTRRHGWVAAEEGVECIPERLMAGEENCMLNRKRLKMAEASGGERMRIVISTDTNDIHWHNASAFIAAAKLAQQFRPIEIWWQGAWLFDDDNVRGHTGGQVFLVPLVQGDLDFSRLMFVLGNTHRDRVSNYIAVACCWPESRWLGEHTAKCSYLDGTDHFVSEKGITPCAKTVAEYAAKWAGLDPAWWDEVSDSSAAQWWAPAQSPRVLTAEEKKAEEKREAENRKYWQEDEKRRKQAAAAAARSRAEALHV